MSLIECSHRLLIHSPNVTAIIVRFAGFIEKKLYIAIDIELNDDGLYGIRSCVFISRCKMYSTEPITMADNATPITMPVLLWEDSGKKWN